MNSSIFNCNRRNFIGRSLAALAETLDAAQDRVEYIIDKFFKEHPEQTRKWESQVPYRI